MRVLSVAFRASIFLLLSASLVSAYSAGGPAGNTGAPAFAGVAAEGRCSCHAGGLPATLELLDVPDFYQPDSVYVLRLRLTRGATGPTKGGYEMTAVRKLDGQGVGTFVIGSATNMQIMSGTGAFATRLYATHNARENSTGSIVWPIRWRAPSTDAGRIYFFASGVSIDGLNSTANDLVKLVCDSVESFALLDAGASGGFATNRLAAPAPNPARGAVTIGYALERAGAAELAVFDAQGRRVRLLLSGQSPAGPGRVTWDGRRDDGSPAEAGAYWAKLRDADGRLLGARRITLLR